MATKKFSSLEKITDDKGYISATKTLYDKLTEVTKNISYLDVYNIVDVVTDKNLLASQISALSNNSSLVINTNPFFIEQEFYNIGDIVLKTNTGRIIHIAAQPGGLYFPSDVVAKDDGTFEIIYKYSSGQPAKESFNKNIASENEAATEAAITMSFSGLTSLNQADNYVYGIWEKFGKENDKTTTEFTSAFWVDETGNKQAIRPEIQFCLVENDVAIEKVIIDFNLELQFDNDNGGYKWVVKIPNNVAFGDSLFIKVK